jgi:hypothetical protein
VSAASGTTSATLDMRTSGCGASFP